VGDAACRAMTHEYVRCGGTIVVFAQDSTLNAQDNNT